ncbi:MAG: phosphotransferase, partial [Candidatus Peribacteraceae bacterium]|nr:phosphotransferase [Candidatus Peribacteraceae bacterium]
MNSQTPNEESKQRRGVPEPEPTLNASTSTNEFLQIEARQRINQQTELIEQAKRELEERFPNLKITSISFLDEGLDNRVFIVNDDYIFRFPKTEKTSKFLEREVTLMPFLAKHVTTKIPSYEFVSMPSERYRTCLAGCIAFTGETLNPECYKSLDNSDRENFLGAIAQFMREMHSVPVEDARKCEGVSEWDDEGTYRWYER